MFDPIQLRPTVKNRLEVPSGFHDAGHRVPNHLAGGEIFACTFHRRLLVVNGPRNSYKCVLASPSKFVYYSEMQDAPNIARIRRKYQLLVPEMDDPMRRRWLPR